MATIKYKPTSNGRRNMTVPSFEELTKFTPEKSLVKTLKKQADGKPLVCFLFFHGFPA